ncbi:MAG: DNA glycosylase AlkZ-like family protein, partial [Myxococcales bacterium]
MRDRRMPRPIADTTCRGAPVPSPVVTPTTPRTVSARAARRFLVRRHLLLPPRSLPPGPASVLDVFARLGSIQFDPLEIAGRNHDLVLLARIAGYRRSMTDSLLYEERRLFETYNKGLSLLPVDELPWYRVFWDRLRIAHEGGAFDEHAPLVQELLDRIRRDGVLSSTDVEPRAAIDWYWRPTNQVRALLEALAEAGILGIARRDGNRRLYDLVERLFPTELLDRRIRPREQFRHKLLSRYRAHGLLGTSGSAELWNGTAPGKAIGAEDGLAVGAAGRRELHAELVDVGELVPVEVEGVRGVRFVVRSDVEMLTTAAIEAERDDRRVPWEAGVAFLAPLDPLVWDRDLLRRLFDFDYVWEVYVPAARRRWGYYVLPILFGDRLVGRIEPRIDRITRSLRVLGLWWEDGFDP